MSVNKKDILKLANASKLKTTEEEAEKLVQELNKVIKWIDKLEEIDTKNTSPIYTLSTEVNNLSEDVSQENNDLTTRKKIVGLSKSSTSSYFEVPSF